MEYVSELVTLLAAGVFAGGAVYVSVAEHPGRTAAGTRVALAQLPGSYRRAAPLPGGSALVALVAGVIAAFASGDWVWTLAGACVGSAVPLTLIVIEPVNTRLMREPDLLADDDATALLANWARLHALRTVLGLAGFVVAAAAALSN